ncbi:MAG: efflux RND transporter periplasmic adaptor subunit [Bacteroidales bacterium]|nr:efflux RND transporter periplasmic adaptor subunit [Bacteroidales bacterium]
MTRLAQRSLGALAALGLVVGLSSCGGDQQQTGSQAPEIATLTIAEGTSNLNSSFPATIKGKTDIEIRPQVTGFITKVHVDEGQHVKKGQVLFTLDQVTYQAAVDAAKASVNVAQTAVETAKITLDNKKKLLDKNIISQYEWQLADNDYRTALSQLASAKANLASAQKNLAYTVVTSPSDGVVGSIPNREGSLASPSSAQALTTVSQNDKIYAYFSLNEKDILQLTENGTRSLDAAIKAMPEVKLQLANGEIYPFSGQVATVSGVIDNTTGSASVRALFDNPSGMLRSGSTGTILIPVTNTNAIIIPQKATFELQDKKFVYVVNDSNVVNARPITIQSLNDGKTYVVTSGLNVGERIATEGVGTKLSEGLQITPVDAAAQAAAQEAAAQQQAAQK